MAVVPQPASCAEPRRTTHPKNKSQPQSAALHRAGDGKMGAYELNYSSDIDLSCRTIRRHGASQKCTSPRRAVRLTQRMVKLPRSAPATATYSVPICACGQIRPQPRLHLYRAALSYYDTGQNWERAAMISAPCAGEISAGEAILNELSPFVWRKYLILRRCRCPCDETANQCLSRVRQMRSKVTISVGAAASARWVFCADAAAIAGGRNPGLRDRDTLTTLDKLCDDKWIDADARDAISRL